MAMSDTDAVKRAKLMDEINVALAELEAAGQRRRDAKKTLDQRINDAKSALGMAEREQEKRELQYATLHGRLAKFLPMPNDMAVELVKNADAKEDAA